MYNYLIKITFKKIIMFGLRCRDVHTNQTSQPHKKCLWSLVLQTLLKQKKFILLPIFVVVVEYPEAVCQQIHLMR